jgi:hypothetical protein
MSFIEFYMQLSLFFADLLQAIGAVTYLKWVGSGHLEVGEFCSAQGDFLFASPPRWCKKPHLTTLGILKQSGEVGVALSTLVSCPTAPVILFS